MLVRGIDIVDWDRERVGVRIRWVDEWPELVSEVWLTAGVHRLIRDWRRDGMSCCEIANTLNDRGIRTRKGRAWSRKDVRSCLARYVRRAKERGDGN